MGWIRVDLCREVKQWALFIELPKDCFDTIHTKHDGNSIQGLNGKVFALKHVKADNRKVTLNRETIYIFNFGYLKSISYQNDHL